MKLFANIVFAAAAISLLNNPAAVAQEYAQAPTEGEQQGAQNAPQRYAVPSQPMAVVGGQPVNNQTQLNILGLWVGNMAFKVGQDANGTLYTISPTGERKLLPAGTDVNSVAVPESSPLIQGLLSQPGSPRVIPEVKDKSGKIIQPQIKLGETGLLTPKVIGTRTMVVNGKPMVMGGAIVSEVPDWRERLAAKKRDEQIQAAYARQQQEQQQQQVAAAQVQPQAHQRSFARVITQKRVIAKKKKTKTAPKRNSRK